MSTVLPGYESDPGPDTDLMFVRELPEMPLHAPVLRADTRRVTQQCCGDCGQGRKACPSPMVCLGLHRVELANGQTRTADAIHRADVQQAGRLLRLKDRLGDAVYWIAAAACIALMFAAPRVFAADAETTATIAAGADTVSTVAAVGSGMAVESNALMASPPVFLAVSALKIAAPRLTRDMEPETRRATLRTMSTVWGGAAANNLAILAGVGCPLCVGVAVGVWLWVDSGKPAATEPATAPEAGAALAMVQP